MRRTTLLITVVASVAIVATAAAQILPLAREPAWKIRDVAEEAGVSSTKVQDFLHERAELRKRLLRTKGNIALARLELEEVFEGDEVDAGDAEAKLEKLLDLEKQLRRDMLAMRIAVRKTFTHEQLEEMRELMPPPHHRCSHREHDPRHFMRHRLGHWLEGDGPPPGEFMGDG
jgi:hypothetical protein